MLPLWQRRVNYKLVPTAPKWYHFAMNRKRKEKLLGRWNLPESLFYDFQDFCEAHRGAPDNRIIADAVRAFIADRLEAEPELKKRFEQARRDRLGIIEGGNVTVLPSAK
jgi:hypothetical protein